MTILAKALVRGATRWQGESFWAVVIRHLAVWRHRHTSRAALRALDARLLYDAGIHPDDAREEARKPFWRA